MNMDIYNYAVQEIELILRGLREQVDRISRDEWLDMGGNNEDFKSDTEKIELNKMHYILNATINEKFYNCELLFKNEQIAQNRISATFNFIKTIDTDFAVMELICYATFVLIYFSMRKMEAIEIEKMANCIFDYIDDLELLEDNKAYLNKLHKIVIRKMSYVYNNINCYNVWKKEDENEYKYEIKKLLDEARNINPRGEVIEIFKEIELVEKFFKDPTEHNVEILQNECFSNANNWLSHIFTCASPKVYNANEDTMKYLPHIKFHTSSDNDVLLMEKIEWSRPKGEWMLGGCEEEWGKFEEKWEEWEIQSYLKILSIPHEVNTKESQGELIYSVLYLLAENKELEKTKNAIVSDFTHRAKNYETDNIYNIARALNSNPSNEELANYGRELLLEYYNKQMMSREIAMLSLEHKDSFDELRNSIRNSRVGKDKGITIGMILDEALKRILLRILLVEGDVRVDDIRNKYEIRGIDTFELLDRYEEELLKGNADCVGWINRYMNTFDVQVSRKWKDLFLGELSDGAVFLMSMMMELLLNMFTYADVSYYMNISFEEEKVNDDLYMIIKTENVVDNSVKSNGRKGLVSRNRILSKINYGKDYKWHDSILKEYSKDNSKCIVTVRICSDVLGGL